MIQEKEIRVGNWFEHLPEWSYRNEDRKSLLFQWESSDWYSLGECTFSLDSVKPIVLSPEILERCGFKKDKDDIYSKLGFMFFLYDIGVVQIALDYSPLCNAPCRYVHQLQNLIYALSGEELKIDLN